MYQNIFGTSLYGELIYQEYGEEGIKGNYKLSLSYNINYSKLKNINLSFAIDINKIKLSNYYFGIDSISKDILDFFILIDNFSPKYLTLYSNIFAKKIKDFDLKLILEKLLDHRRGFYIKINKNIKGTLNYYTFVNKGTFFVMVYQFVVTPYDSTGSLISNFEWELYRRDPIISLFEPVDDNHILVDNGTEPSGILNIDLSDYGLEDIDDDYFIKITYEGVLVGTTYIEYDHQKFFEIERKQPYHQVQMIHRVIKQDGQFIGGGGGILKVQEEKPRPKINIKSLNVHNNEIDKNYSEKNIKVKLLLDEKITN